MRGETGSSDNHHQSTARRPSISASSAQRHGVAVFLERRVDPRFVSRHLKLKIHAVTPSGSRNRAMQASDTTSVSTAYAWCNTECWRQKEPSCRSTPAVRCVSSLRRYQRRMRHIAAQPSSVCVRWCRSSRHAVSLGIGERWVIRVSSEEVQQATPAAKRNFKVALSSFGKRQMQ